MTFRLITGGAVLALATILAPAEATAAPVTFNFSGTLVTGISGNTSVTGQFTLDGSTLVDASFTTPAGTFTAANSFQEVMEITSVGPVPDQDTTYVRVVLSSVPNFIALNFAGTLSGFSGGPLFTDAVPVAGASAGTGVSCLSLSSICTEPLLSPFSSGSATIATTPPVPEPAALTLLGLAAAGLLVRRRRAQ